MSSAPLPPHAPLERYYRHDSRDGPDSADQRRAFVTELFDRTAPHYDWLNRVMSFGSGVKYRQEALERSGLEPGARVLDVAIGTGLTARAVLNATEKSARVIGVDASGGMLGQARAVGIPLVQALAERLPLASSSFDLLTMGYALRHVADLKATFREYYRVLRPRGRLVILELTRPSGSRLHTTLARLYLRRIMPFVAQLGPGGSDSRRLMEYYWDTIDGCVPPDTVLEALSEAGFEHVERRLFWSVFSEYVAKSGPDETRTHAES